MSAELERVERDWAEALVRRDVEAAERILADDFVLTSAGGVSDHMPRAAWLEALPGIETRVAEPSDLRVREFGDAAVVGMQFRWEARFGERDLTGDYAITDVFTRADGGWRVSWRISTRLPGA
jgi:ketosteroid isomerase-like protein